MTEPQFALNSGLLAIYWICAGRAYEATVGEVQRAYDLTLQAADTAQGTALALERIQQILNSFPQERFVRGALAKASGLPGDFR